MPLFQIVRGVISSNGTVTKPGDIVDWTEEQAATWYPRDKGAIVRLPDHKQPKPAEPVSDVIQEATVEPVIGGSYQEPETEQEKEQGPGSEPDPDPKPEKRSKKHYRGR